VVKFNPENLSTKVYDVKRGRGAGRSGRRPQKFIDLESAQEIKKKYRSVMKSLREITPKTGTNYGRIAAQTAKQSDYQKLREAERQRPVSDFKSKDALCKTALSSA